MIASLLSGLWPYILGSLGVLGALWAARVSGSARARSKMALAEERDKTQTLERIINAPFGSNTADALDELRKRKPTGNLHRNRK